MNDRIRELAKRTGIWHVTAREDLLGDFAELIIKDCIEALRLVPYKSLEIDFGEEVPYQDAIKKHFGVEDND